jgi:Ca-activated chloride channel family protein
MSGYVNIHSEGIDIVLVLDLSGSMSFVDGIPDDIISRQKGTTHIYMDENGDVLNRLDIAKKILIEFVEKRRQDRIGLVIFSDYPYTESPVTISRDIIQQKISKIDFSGTKGQSTAMGDAIISAVNKLAPLDSKSKVIILTTDGNSNKGEDPIAMSQIAADEGIKIYSIGIGGKDVVLRPQEGLTNDGREWTVYEEVPMEDGERLDEDTLRRIADITGGKFFLGSNESELRQIYNEIDTLEKSEADFENIYVDYEEQFFPFVMAGLILLLLAFFLENTFLRILP